MSIAATNAADMPSPVAVHLHDRRHAGPASLADTTPDYTVVAVTATGNEGIHMQPQARLRIMWDADSVPYTAAVMAAALQELGGAQVRALSL